MYELKIKVGTYMRGSYAISCLYPTKPSDLRIALQVHVHACA